MSGICGLVNFNDAPVESALLTRMAESVAYRGPDGIHYWQKGTIGFAHLSLRITPESLREVQPLVTRDVILIADARIDNRDELMRLLAADLHSEAPTDLDLILAAYKRWGTDCAAYLIGDFVFALWDERQQHFFAARDPMGLRTLYYWHTDQQLAFANEVKQLLTLPYIPVRLYEPAVGVYLSGPFLPLDWSFYVGIRQLAPGHALVIGVEGCCVWRFWDADPARTIRYRREEEYAAHFLEIFKEAVACRLRSIKPVGLSLSGGVDSGSIASTIGWLFQQQRVSHIPFRAYCWAFDELVGSDERHISRGITGYYGLQQVDIPADHLWPLKDYLAHGPDIDDPFIGIYQALNDVVFATAQQDGIGVMLSGFRGDEVTGSWYVDFVGMLLSFHWKTLWHEIKALQNDQNLHLWHVIKQHLLRPFRLLVWPHPLWRGPSSRPYPALIRDDFAARINLAERVRDPFSVPRTVRHYGWHQRYHQIFSSAAVRVASHTERRQAQFSIVHADPWSDRRIAEFVLAVPQWVVQRYSDRKRLARSAIQPLLPPHLPHPLTKIEPEAFFNRGFQERAKDTILELILNSIAAERGYVDKAEFLAIYQDYLQGIPARHELWWPLTLEMWLRQFWK